MIFISYVLIHNIMELLWPQNITLLTVPIPSQYFSQVCRTYQRIISIHRHSCIYLDLRNTLDPEE